ncbi:hypothetical protein ACWDTP_17240 [Mycobacterium sp. NPDC003449]
MRTNWLSRLADGLAATFNWQGPAGIRDYVDRDEERVRRELDLIRLRFQHHS